LELERHAPRARELQRWLALAACAEPTLAEGGGQREQFQAGRVVGQIAQRKARALCTAIDRARRGKASLARASRASPAKPARLHFTLAAPPGKQPPRKRPGLAPSKLARMPE
jgi:hypothetical protein